MRQPGPWDLAGLPWDSLQATANLSSAILKRYVNGKYQLKTYNMSLLKYMYQKFNNYDINVINFNACFKQLKLLLVILISSWLTEL